MSPDIDLQQLAIDRSATGQPRFPSRRHILTRYVVPGVLLFGFLSLIAWHAQEFLFPPTNVTVVPVLATQDVVQQEGTPLFQAAGWVEPRPTAIRVAALAKGVVEHLLVVEDQTVREDEPVAELVKDDAKLACDRAAADVALRQAELEEAQAVLIAAETRLEQPVHLRAALGEANAALAKIETELKDLPFAVRRAVAECEVAQKVYDGMVAAEGVVAGVDIDRAKSTLDSARALLDELRNRTNSLNEEKKALTQRRDANEKQLELLADEIEARDEALAKTKAAAARLSQVRVIVAEAQLRLDRMTVRAPVDGKVYQLVADPGTTLTAGMSESGDVDGSTVVTLYRPSRLQVRVDVRFEDVPKVSLGQNVRIENAALASPLAGKVLYVSSEADIQKNTLQVKVEILSPPLVVKPEMLVDVTFLAGAEPAEASEDSKVMRFFIPQQLIHRDENGAFVWVADQTARVAHKVPVQTGIVGTNGLVEIKSGLSISNRLIADGSDGLQDGDRIKVSGDQPTQPNQTRKTNE